MVGKFEGLLDATVGTGARVVGARVGGGEETAQTKPDPVKPFTRRNEKVRDGHNDKIHDRMIASNAPSLHLQVNPPALLVHLAFLSQGFEVTHSLISVQDLIPSPV